MSYTPKKSIPVEAGDGAKRLPGDKPELEGKARTKAEKRPRRKTAPQRPRR